MGIFYSGGNWIVRRTSWLFADCRVSGRERVPKTGPLIVVANHQSNMDPPMIAAFVPRRMRFPAKAEIFEKGWAAYLLNAWGAFPLKRGETDRQAYEWLLAELAKPSGAVALFPEGTRTPRGMRRAKSGIATLALRSGATLLPVGLTGTEGMSNYFRALWPTGKIRIKIGEPFTVRPGWKPESKEELDVLATEIMGRIACLLPEEYRGAYSDAAAAPPQHTVDIAVGL